jgi:hypothetical protein
VLAYDFRCDDCGYVEPCIAGGRDPKRLCVTETMTCHDCRRLVDVVVEVRRSDELREPRSSSPLLAELESLQGTCEHCGGTSLTAWGRGSTAAVGGLFRRIRSWGPCPRCGSPIRTTTQTYRTD